MRGGCTRICGRKPTERVRVATPVSPAPWPLFDLTVTTPRLTLRYANDALLLELAAVAHDVIAPEPDDGGSPATEPDASAATDGPKVE